MRISDWSSDVCSSDLDHPPDADRTAKDVGDAVAIIVAEEAQHPRAHLVERAGARKGADEIIIARPVEDETAIVDEIADRTSVVEGKRVSVRVDIGCGCSIKNKNTNRLDIDGRR